MGWLAGWLAGYSVIVSRRVPVNEGCLPLYPPQPSSGSPPHKAWVTEQVIKGLNAMSQHFSLHLISSECSADPPLPKPPPPPPLMHSSPFSLCSRLNPFLPPVSGKHFMAACFKTCRENTVSWSCDFFVFNNLHPCHLQENAGKSGPCALNVFHPLLFLVCSLLNLTVLTVSVGVGEAEAGSTEGM